MITLHNLHFQYSQRKKVFQNLDLELEAGRIYGLLGKNAAGKSTLLRLMSGLLSPTSGNCEVNGFSSARRQPAFLSEVFLIPEEVWLPEMKIGKYIETHAPFYPKFDRDQFYTWLREFEVPENEHMSNLSFGQKKKLVIAFGLAANTKIVLMDEPTNGLDIPSKAEFRRIVASALDENRTLVISTHQVRDLDSLIDGVILVEGGEILIDATLDKVSDTLTFAVENSVNESDTNLLFAEGGIFGKQTVRENTTGKISRVDLELLFQAAVNNPTRMKAIFKKG